jgi:hypothetical protein
VHVCTHIPALAGIISRNTSQPDSAWDVGHAPLSRAHPVRVDVCSTTQVDTWAMPTTFEA